MQNIGRYQVVSELGRGAMGVVYLVRAPGASRELALKMIKEVDPSWLERFRREGQAMQFLGRHEHIVGLWEVGEHQGYPYLVMDYIEGGKNLLDVVKEGLGSLEERARMVADVARAVGFAHGAGFVHRDIKPANIMVDPSGRALLTDFGLARHVLDDKLTQTGTILGSPAYMAPEQVDQSGKVDGRADVYALGATLYHVLCGRPPFVGQQISVLKKVLADDPPTPTELEVDVPPALEDVCLRAIAKLPEDRPQTAEAFAAELEQALGAGAPAPRRGGLPAWSLVAAILVCLTVGLGAGLGVGLRGKRTAEAVRLSMQVELTHANERLEEVHTQIDALELQAKELGTLREAEHRELINRPGAATALLKTVADVEPTDLESAARVGNTILRALRLDWEAVCRDRERSAQRLRAAAALVLATADRTERGHAQRVERAHDWLVACRVLRPNLELTEEVKLLHELCGEGSDHRVRSAARPFLALWPEEFGGTILPVEDFDLALTKDYTEAELTAVDVPGIHKTERSKTFPAPWGILLQRLRRQSSDWGRSSHRRSLYRAYVGFLIERADLPFLYYYAAFAARDVGEHEIARGLIEAATPMARQAEVLNHYSILLFSMGRYEQALVMNGRCLRMLDHDPKLERRWTLQLRADTLYMLGRDDEALATLDELWKRYGQSRHHLGQSLHYWRVKASIEERMGVPTAKDTRTNMIRIHAMWLRERTNEQGWRR